MYMYIEYCTTRAKYCDIQSAHCSSSALLAAVLVGAKRWAPYEEAYCHIAKDMFNYQLLEVG